MFTGNKLICDCRLTWIQMLRNETKSEPLRLALEDVTCTIHLSSNERLENDKDDNNPTSSEYQTNNVNIVHDKSKSSDNLQSETISEVLEQNDGNDEELYEDTPTAYQNNPTLKTVVMNQLRVVDVPASQLTCEVLQNREDSLMLSSKVESFWSSSASIRVSSKIYLTLLCSVVLFLNFLSMTKS